jgi:multisubunit Na+/H+ antiporter MnhG subunit
MFQNTNTLLMFMVLTIVVFSVVITNPVFNQAAAQGRQYSFVTKWGSEGIGLLW